MKGWHSKLAYVILLMLFVSAFTWFNPGPRRYSPWVGRWQTSDSPGDQSVNTLTVSYNPVQKLYNLTWEETYFSLCQGEDGIGRGTGEETGEGLIVELEFYCQGELTLTLNIPFEYDAASDTITSDANNLVQTWNRIPLRMPAKGISTS
ncbi:MAG: hypothetical protein PVF49_13390 [Anaerolineales bacterium]|jgi:hypothetical protein